VSGKRRKLVIRHPKPNPQLSPAGYSDVTNNSGRRPPPSRGSDGCWAKGTEADSVCERLTEQSRSIAVINVVGNQKNTRHFLVHTR
jgi:hypothetical protein